MKQPIRRSATDPLNLRISAIQPIRPSPSLEGKADRWFGMRGGSVL
jgi:hypothetical protein